MCVCVWQEILNSEQKHDKIYGFYIDCMKV